ncbi:MAG: adenylyltransferase/cytidyltransferase family protein [Patescibacteria group bacterium]
MIIKFGELENAMPNNNKITSKNIKQEKHFNIATWGTFDNLHEGHLEFLNAAKLLGNKLFVIIVPDEAVMENKGHLPLQDENLRKSNLEKLGFIDKVFIDSFDKQLESLKQINPDIFCLGHDQDTVWEARLKKCF